jgi:hypothetical protein
MKKSIYLLLLILSFAFTIKAQSLAGNYTVGPNGEFGSLQQAFDNLAANGVSDNVVLNVEAGIYTEQLSLRNFNPWPYTLSIKGTLVDGMPGTMLSAASATGENTNILKLENANNVFFSDIQFQLPSGLGFTNIVEIDGQAALTGFTNCEFQFTGTDGSALPQLVSVSGSNKVSFSKCTFDGGLSGIIVQDALQSADISLTTNTFSECSAKYIDISGAGYIHFEDNTFADLKQDNGIAVHFQSVKNNLVFIRNTVSGTNLIKDAVTLQNVTAKVLFMCNVLSGNASEALVGATNCPNLRIYNNSLSNANTATGGAVNVLGSGIKMYNNLVATGGSNLINIQQSVCASNYNLFYNANSSPSSFKLNSSNFTLADWQLHPRQDQNSNYLSASSTSVSLQPAAGDPNCWYLHGTGYGFLDTLVNDRSGNSLVSSLNSVDIGAFRINPSCQPPALTKVISDNATDFYFGLKKVLSINSIDPTLQVTYYPGAAAPGISNDIHKFSCYWKIDGNTNQSLQYTAYFDTALIGTVTPTIRFNTLDLYYRNSRGEWDFSGLPSLSARDTSNTTYHFSGNIAAINGFLTITNMLQPLPLTWVSFDVSKNEDDQVRLQWSVMNENAADKYVAQRSADGKVWESFDSINVKGYSQSGYNVQCSQHSGTYFYRVMQVDLNGGNSYSPVRKISDPHAGEQTDNWVAANAARGLVYYYESANDEPAAISVISVSGQVLSTRKLQLHEGLNDISFDSLPQGAYTIVVHKNSGDVCKKCIVAY